jgi:hypothetical protein
MIIAFDPGAVRTGVAIHFESPVIPNIVCFSFEPWDAVEWLSAQSAESCRKVLLESWVAYPHAQAGNAWRRPVEVLTLGALEWECTRKGIPYEYQPTSILEPTRRILDHDGYNWVSTNRDEKAAETHLMYHKLREEQ